MCLTKETNPKRSDRKGEFTLKVFLEVLGLGTKSGSV